jgi:ketosteroid isomerase-like protein
MSQENVGVVRRHQEAFNRGDLMTMLELTSPDIEWWDRADDPDASVHRGYDAVMKHLAEFDDLAELRVEPREFIDAGDFVVVPTRQVGRGRTSGAFFEEDQVNVFRVRDGRVTQLREYSDRSEALKAVGLEE